MSLESSLVVPVTGHHNSDLIILNGELQKPSLDAAERLKRRIFDEIDTAKREVRLPAKKIIWLQTLTGEMKELRSCCKEIEDRCTAEIQKQEMFSPERIADLFHINFFGKYGRLSAGAKAIEQELSHQVAAMTAREMEALHRLNIEGNPDSVSILQLYDLLAALQPEDKKYLEGQAERLMMEKVYLPAVEALGQFSANCLPTDATKFKVIHALKGAQKYEEALKAIFECKMELNNQENSTQVAGLRAALDNLKVDCLIGQKKYGEAKTVLQNLLRTFPQSSATKKQLVFVTLLDELREGGQKTEKFCFAKSKNMFGHLDEYSASSWTDDSLVYELDFWLFVLSSQRIVHEDKALHAYVFHEIEELVNSGMITTAELILTRIKQSIDELEKETTLFLQQFHTFIQDTASEVRLAPNIKEALMNARLQSMKDKLYGTGAPEATAGILHKMRSMEALLTHFTRHKRFQESKDRALIQSLKDVLSVVNSKILTCRESLVTMHKEKFHPYVNALQGAIESPAFAALPSTKED